MFRKILECVLPKNVIELVRTLRWLPGQIEWLSRATGRNEENILKLYKMLLSQQTKHSHQLFAAHSLINNYEMKFYSQNGEDGILLYLFSLIGTTNRKFVEIGCGNGLECCSANLSLNFGWSGLLVDCDETNIAVAKDAYGKLLGHTAAKVQIVQQWVDKDNINALLEHHAITGEIDLLIIDIDGNDYWIWQTIRAVDPRVVVLEYNASFLTETACTVPYSPSFDRYKFHDKGWFHGVSLKGAAQLGKQKGYTLVGCDSAGVNAFFIRKDALAGLLPEMSVDEAFYPHIYRSGDLFYQHPDVRYHGIPMKYPGGMSPEEQFVAIKNFSAESI